MTLEETKQFLHLVGVYFPNAFKGFSTHQDSEMVAIMWQRTFADYTPEEMVNVLTDYLKSGVEVATPSLGQIFGELNNRVGVVELKRNLFKDQQRLKQIGTEQSYDPRMWSEEHPHPTYDPELQKECEEMLERILKEGGNIK